MLHVLLLSHDDEKTGGQQQQSKKTKKKEQQLQVVIKLFYHCVVISGDACHRAFQSFTTTANNKRSDKEKRSDIEKMGMNVIQYAMLCLGAYEGLGHCLYYGDDAANSNNKLLNNNSSSKKKKDGRILWDEVIPLPTSTSSVDTKKKETGGLLLGQQQLIKLGMESALSVASSLLYMSLVGITLYNMNDTASSSSAAAADMAEGRVVEGRRSSSLVIPNEFHFTSSLLHEMCSGWGEYTCTSSSSSPMFSKIMFNVVTHYVLSSLFLDGGVIDDSSKGGSSSSADTKKKKETTMASSITFNVDAIRHVKKAFRLLWDGARTIDDICNSSSGSSSSSSSSNIKKKKNTRGDDDDELRISCLTLQQDAILFLLQILDKVLQRITNESSGIIITSDAKNELVALFDRASSSAMKSVGMFDKSTSVFHTSTSSTSSKKISDRSSSSSRVKGALYNFHRVVGNELDNVVNASLLPLLHTSRSSSTTAGEEKLLPLPPASYYEYCVYRSIHVWRLNGPPLSEEDSTRQHHVVLQSPKQIDSGSEIMDSVAAAHATYTIVALVLRVYHQLKHPSMEESSMLSTKKKKKSMNDDEMIEHAISNFEQVILKSSSSTTTCLSRCRSMLLMLNLQKEVSRIISSFRLVGEEEEAVAKKKDESSSDDSLIVLAIILKRCLAPLERKLAHSSTKKKDDESRALNLRLSSIDCAVKSASLFDIIASSSEQQRNNKAYKTSKEKTDAECKYIIEADTQLQHSFDMLVKELSRLGINSKEECSVTSFRNVPTIVAIEMFAKAATVIGRRRYDRSDDVRISSIQPQILASEIITKVAIRATGKELFTTYQIANRYMILSSTLERSGNYSEACAALAMAVWCSIESLAIDDGADKGDDVDSTSEEILRFPNKSNRSQKDVAVDVLAPIVKRLVRTYIAYKAQSNNDDTSSARENNDDSSISSMLQSTLMGKMLTVASTSTSSASTLEENKNNLQFSKLFHCAVWNKKRYEEELSITQIADIVREILKTAIRTVKSSIANDNEDARPCWHCIDELKLFLHAQIKRIGDVNNAISSSFHVTFAAQLIDLRFVCFPRLSSWAMCKKSLFNNNNNKLRDYKLLQLACNQLQHAEKKFNESSSSRDDDDDDEISSIQHDVRFFAQWAAVQLNYAILLEHVSTVKLSEAAAKSEADHAQIHEKEFKSVKAQHISALGTCR